MKVNFYATLRAIVGQKTLEIPEADGATLGELLEEILQRYPDLRPELFDGEGNFYRHVHVFVNGRDAPYLEWGMDTPLTREDVIGIFPAVGGG